MNKNNALILESCNRMIEYGCYNESIAMYYKKLTGKDIEEQYSDDEIIARHKIKGLNELFFMGVGVHALVCIIIASLAELFLYTLGVFTQEVHKYNIVFVLVSLVVILLTIFLAYKCKAVRNLLRMVNITLKSSMVTNDIDFYVMNGYARVKDEEDE